MRLGLTLIWPPVKTRLGHSTLRLNRAGSQIEAWFNNNMVASQNDARSFHLTINCDGARAPQDVIYDETCRAVLRADFIAFTLIPEAQVYCFARRKDYTVGVYFSYWI